MASGIDHLVLAVTDLDTAADALAHDVGLVCTGGGRHEGLGTANRIAFLADGSYVELMTVEDPAAALAWPIGRETVRAMAAGGGLAAVALNDDDLPATVSALRAAGSSIGLPVPGERRRPDGEAVRWWTAVAEPMGADALPFLIRHDRSGSEWSQAAVASRASIPHPAGRPVRLVQLDLAVPDPAALAELHRRELGLQYRQVGAAQVCTLGRHVIRLVACRDGTLDATVRLAASGPPRRVDALGVHWEVGD